MLELQDSNQRLQLDLAAVRQRPMASCSRIALKISPRPPLERLLLWCRRGMPTRWRQNLHGPPRSGSAGSGSSAAGCALTSKTCAPRCRAACRHGAAHACAPPAQRCFALLCDMQPLLRDAPTAAPPANRSPQPQPPQPTAPALRIAAMPSQLRSNRWSSNCSSRRPRPNGCLLRSKCDRHPCFASCLRAATSACSSADADAADVATAAAPVAGYCSAPPAPTYQPYRFRSSSS